MQGKRRAVYADEFGRPVLAGTVRRTGSFPPQYESFASPAYQQRQMAIPETHLYYPSSYGHPSGAHFPTQAYAAGYSAQRPHFGARGRGGRGIGGVGRGVGRGFGGTGRIQSIEPPPSKVALDDDLDAYMGRTKTVVQAKRGPTASAALDDDLDAYNQQRDKKK